MSKYRIVEKTFRGTVYFTVQKKRWYGWRYFCDNGRGGTCISLSSAREDIDCLKEYDRLAKLPTSVIKIHKY